MTKPQNHSLVGLNLGSKCTSDISIPTLKSFTISGRVQEYGYDKENSLLQNLASCEKIEEVKLLNAKFVTNNDLNAVDMTD